MHNLVGDKTYFIADIGANHDGSLDRAKTLIKLAKDAGADCAKFQHFKAESIVSDRGFKSLGKMTHQAKWEKDVFQVYEDYSINRDWNQGLADTAESVGIDFMTTPYDCDAADQVEEERTQENLDKLNARFSHDPFWRSRFWSIQHVHDCIEGKAFHWFWSPMKEVFSLSQIMFMLIPMLAYFHSLSVWQMVWWVLVFKCITAGAKPTIEWYHNWRFINVWKRASRDA